MSQIEILELTCGLCGLSKSLMRSFVWISMLLLIAICGQSDRGLNQHCGDTDKVEGRRSLR